VRACVRSSTRDSRGSFMFPRYLQYLLTDFRQTFVTSASCDTDDLITFLGQKVKVQGHTIAAEAHSTRLFLVSYTFTQNQIRSGLDEPLQRYGNTKFSRMRGRSSVVNIYSDVRNVAREE